MKNPYIPIILSIIPRILSNLDRDPQSPGHGCFDRNHWLLKIRPFSSAPLQQSCLTLAIVYSHNFQGNLYYQHHLIKEWCLASICFWKKIQNKNGSFDEYFKREGSFPSTAFTSFAVSESYKLMDLDDNSILNSLVASVEYLTKRIENFAVNQEIAAICAIYNLFLLTKNQEYMKIVDMRIEHLKEIQSKEGFFYEHGGADIGYLTVSLSYLAILYKLSKRTDLVQMCESVLDYISYFVHPDGTMGGIYGSRNTEYFAPAGFEILSTENALASTIIKKLFSNIKKYDYVNLSIDDRYLLHYLGPLLAIALINHKNNAKVIRLPYKKTFNKLFSQSGLYIFSTKDIYLIISLRKGGCFKLYFKGKLLMNDLGYKIIKNRKVYCTEFEDNSENFHLATNRIKVKKRFCRRNYFTPKPIYFCMVHLYSFLFRGILWNFFRKLFIQKHKKSDYHLEREFVLNVDSILINDTVLTNNPIDLFKCNNQSIKIIPSSKFFQLSELEDKFVPFVRSVTSPIKIATEIDLVNSKVMTFSKAN